MHACGFYFLKVWDSKNCKEAELYNLRCGPTILEKIFIWLNNFVFLITVKLVYFGIALLQYTHRHKEQKNLFSYSKWPKTPKALPNLEWSWSLSFDGKSLWQLCYVPLRVMFTLKWSWGLQSPKSSGNIEGCSCDILPLVGFFLKALQCFL